MNKIRLALVALALTTSAAGAQPPVVVLQAGLGDGEESWSTVLPEIQSRYTVFAYDRPGYGASPAVDGPRDPCTIAKELRAALKAAGHAPPYVLVGHSFGGLYQYVFAKLYPEEVAGLMLLDPTHPDHWRRVQEDAPGVAAFMKAMRYVAFSPVMRAEFDDQARCLDRIDTKTPLAIPARLLTRTQFAFPESAAFEATVRSLEGDWRRLLGVTEVQHVAGAGHYIQRDRPDVVVQELIALQSRVTTTSR